MRARRPGEEVHQRKEHHPVQDARRHTSIQLDLYANLEVDRILLGSTPLEYTRELNAVFVDFPEPLKKGRVYAIDFHYWWKLVRDVYQKFQYQNIMAEDLVRFFNDKTGLDLTPVFNPYRRHAEIPTLELAFRDGNGSVAYRWNANEKGFVMPIRVGRAGKWQTIRPTTDWQTMSTSLEPEDLEVATDLYYVTVSRK